MAIPYIRKKYGPEFSILQLNSVTLILHLSLCDLLYAIIGFPHLIHSYLYKTNIYSAEVCYFLGVFRNLVAYTDFNNIALISCCLARQILCKYFEKSKLVPYNIYPDLESVMVFQLSMIVMTACLEEGKSTLLAWDCG